MQPLFHYTCEHGFAGICADGMVRPNRATGLAWFTDMAVPDRDTLGLTMKLLTCDRMAHRFRVLRLAALRRADEVVPVAALRAMSGDPSHWWVAWVPVPVVLDERRDSPEVVQHSMEVRQS